jgi:hypothetical protein
MPGRRVEDCQMWEARQMKTNINKSKAERESQ